MGVRRHERPLTTWGEACVVVVLVGIVVALGVSGLYLWHAARCPVCQAEERR